MTGGLYRIIIYLDLLAMAGPVSGAALNAAPFFVAIVKQIVF